MIIGPSAEAAQLEGSKAYAKAFMMRHGIPTAAYREFTAKEFEEGLRYLNQHSLPIVLKADGLAAGKGVVICQTHEEAVDEFREMLMDLKFGNASSKVVVEEFLSGIELSVFVLTDGKDYVLLPEAKDYKRIGEGDTGLNTGGMGAISPVPFADSLFMNKVITKVVEPTIRGLEKDQLNYKGFVFFGLIKVNEEPYVIEYNCRMGDPETEVVMPRIDNDLVELLVNAATGKLKEAAVEINPSAAATIVAVSGGYPSGFEKGFPITGIQHQQDGTIVFHAGTKQQEEEIVTAGGRVLCVTSLAANIQEAVQKSRNALENISFKNMYFRNDIGYEFIQQNHSK
jgi:phosphoribosylamine---glycine ligase